MIIWIGLICLSLFQFGEGLQIHSDDHSGSSRMSTAAFLSILNHRMTNNNNHHHLNHKSILQQRLSRGKNTFVPSFKSISLLGTTANNNNTNNNSNYYYGGNSRSFHHHGHSTYTSIALSVRNGATATNDSHNDDDDDDDDVMMRQSNNNNNNRGIAAGKKKYGVLGLSVVSLLYFIWSREAVRTFDFRGWLIRNLDYANSFGNVGLVYYAMAFALWEIVVGVTTPVETAAGMAFGVKRGIIANAIGKLGGAILAFLLGRFVFRDAVSAKLENNEMMNLVQESIQSNPIGVALIWRFSFLPESVKNFGLAILPLKTIHFITAVILHGFPFTCLWSFMGAEADMLVRGVVTEPSKILKVMVYGVYVFGFFISPTLVGLWVKSLKDRQKEKSSKLN